MAKQRYGINDGYRGTVGTVIGYMWRGQWCLRARPRFVHNPRTAKQQSNRLLFKQMVALAGSMKAALRKGLRRRSLEQHMTECNQFVKYNKGCYALDGDGKLAVDWERLIVSEGEVVPVGWTAGVSPAPTVTMPAGSRRSKREEADGGVCITIPFEGNPLHLPASGGDEVYVYAYCPEAGEGVLSAPAYRRTQSVQLQLPGRWQGKTVHLYGFVTDYRGDASETVYIGHLEPEPVMGEEPGTDGGGYRRDDEAQAADVSVPQSTAITRDVGTMTNRWCFRRPPLPPSAGGVV